jgi:hypothetical protein
LCQILEVVWIGIVVEMLLHFAARYLQRIAIRGSMSRDVVRWQEQDGLPDWHFRGSGLQETAAMR